MIIYWKIVKSSWNAVAWACSFISIRYISVTTEESKRTGNVKYLALFLYCNEHSELDHWTVDCTSEWVLLNNGIEKEKAKKVSNLFFRKFSLIPPQPLSDRMLVISSAGQYLRGRQAFFKRLGRLSPLQRFNCECETFNKKSCGIYSFITPESFSGLSQWRQDHYRMSRENSENNWNWVSISVLGYTF